MTAVVDGTVTGAAPWCDEHLEGSREDNRVGGVDPRLTHHCCNGLNKGHHSQGARRPLPPESPQQQHRPVAHDTNSVSQVCGCRV